MTDTQVLIAAIVAILALVGTVVSAVVAFWQKATSDLVHSLQTEVAALRAELAGYRTREYVADDYIASLRDHIDQRLPPPPPPFPPGLTR